MDLIPRYSTIMFKKKKEEKEKGKAEDEENDFPTYFMGCGGKQ